MARKQLGTNPVNTVDAATKAYVDAAIGSPTSVTLKDTNFTLQDDGDTTKQMQFQLSGITTGNTRVLTVPDASTTLVGTTIAQTLTNKTISGASNTFSSLSQISITETVSSSSASSLTLTASNSTYVFTGSSAATWTLPAVSGNTGIILRLMNRGTAAVTVQRAGSDNMYNQGATATSIIMAKGGRMTLVNDGTYWLVTESYLPTPAFDSVSSAWRQSGVASGTAFTWTHTSIAASPYAIVAVFGDNNFSETTIAATTSVTFGGTAMTKLNAAYFNGGSANNSAMWVFAASNVPTGTQTVSVTFTESGKSFTGYGTSYTYASITSAGTLQTAIGTSVTPAVNVTPSTSNPSIIWGGMLVQEAGTITLNNSMIPRQFNSGSGFQTWIAGDIQVASTSAFSVNGTSSASNPWVAMGLSLT